MNLFYLLFLVWVIYEQVCVAACDCGHIDIAKVWKFMV
jgi:hypothetical protein